jgi:hypothetical protein
MIQWAVRLLLPMCHHLLLMCLHVPLASCPIRWILLTALLLLLTSHRLLLTSHPSLLTLRLQAHLLRPPYGCRLSVHRDCAGVAVLVDPANAMYTPGRNRSAGTARAE